MSIVVIGAVTKDTLIFLEKDKCRAVESLGGVLYSVIALAELTEKKIYPISNVGYDIYDEVISILKEYDNIDVLGIQKTDARNIHCYIMFKSEYGTQYDENLEVPIVYPQVEPLLDSAKFIFLSSMTGLDFSLELLKKIKQTAKCPIYFDYHILALARDKLGNRYLHRRDDWFEWCVNCDYLQLNKFEAELLYGKRLPKVCQIKDFCKPVLCEGVKSIAITLGVDGSKVCYENSKGEIEIEHLNPVRFNKIVDTTGCGDVFAAGFISHFLETGNLLDSYKFANKVAGLKTQIGDVEALQFLLNKDGEQWHEG